MLSMPVLPGNREEAGVWQLLNTRSVATSRCEMLVRERSVICVHSQMHYLYFIGALQYEVNERESEYDYNSSVT